MMRFGSVCSGIEAASVAWPFWQAAWFSEIEPFPCAVLKHHYPEVPNHGDMTTLPDRILSGEVEAPDVFCGGTPCQAFSVAGNRKSLDDARGNLSLTFCEIADAIDAIRYADGKRPAVIFWENVPGCRNTKDNFFGCFLAKLCGATEALEIENGKWPTNGLIVGERRRVAWATLDARWFGLAQRRKRVFVVAYDNALVEHFGMPCPSEILSLGTCLPRNPTESGKTRQGITADAESGPVCAEISPTVTNGPPFSRTGNERVDCDALVVSQHGNIAGTLTARHDSSPCADRGMNVIATIAPHALKVRGGCEGGGKGYLGMDEQVFTITTGHDQQVAVATNQPNEGNQYASSQETDTIETLRELREAVGEKEFAEWGLGILDSLQSPEILRAWLHGASIRQSPCEKGSRVDDRTLSRKENMPAGALSVLWESGPDGCSSHGRKLAQQLAREFGKALPVMPHQGAQKYAVRRLTPIEAERLQGFPDNYTNIPWRNKPEAPDGPRYKALGNSWAVPCVTWIGIRINEAVK